MSVGSVHLVSTLFMAGVIVFVQVVHYPLMARVGADGFQAYQAGHTTRTTLVVVPPMLLELATGALLVAAPPLPSLQGIAWLGAGLLAVVWASTFLLQVPAHGRLTHGFDAKAHRRLVASNWIRTVAWLARVPVALALAT